MLCSIEFQIFLFGIFISCFQVTLQTNVCSYCIVLAPVMCLLMQLMGMVVVPQETLPVRAEENWENLTHS
jgi:hypothetical protein